MAERSQLPHGMEHCTIRFKKCERGHGWLTATNWVQHQCLTCQLDRLLEENARLLRELHELRGSSGHPQAPTDCDRPQPTREQILAEPTGQRLNAWVAEYVMLCYEKRRMGSNGLFVYDLIVPGGVDQIDYTVPGACWLACPKYSESIAEAWPIMERLSQESGWAITYATHSKHGKGWFVVDDGEYDFVSLSGPACETAPLAICRAALLAKLNGKPT